ncbi:class I SAM-dependent methyltransferase [Terrisporobacter mayombei]|uniref:Ubiquinone biosynthesis O-methyltransferase, mitochondrial n=1 Tax=Terrisporobacter mayombei TaxID=1541 RepID=A0ABY9Q165_9FIRM|nr:class I SAM-dependent methyltransferase [Terrisporobacter mayombei]MCC3867099.1 methyltransferase domain-containing protein [Terrisporobacter mayombei]WMT81359.1 Ubiquinone biosynthesis O-methyltransferase, mitochondrial [Terrisporobacter mayombei]
MDINEIKLKWRLKDQDKEANINLWDEKADHFGNYTIPTMENDKFIKLLKYENLINDDFKVLDVGCGGGKYTLALSRECRHIYGMDLSPKMIDYANENKRKFNINNAYFICEDWHELNMKKSNLYKKFDLVFASMTPAIQSASTLEKMNEASKKYCVLRSNIKRKESVYDKLGKIFNILDNEQNLNFLYTLNMLFLQGYMPKINYEEKRWLYKEPLEKACRTYIKRIKIIRRINEDEEKKIIQILKDISHNGYIEEEINSTIATLIWSVG